MRAVQTVGIIIVAFAALSGCIVGVGPDRVIDRTYEVPAGAGLTVTADVGSVTVESWTGPTMAVTATVRSTAPFFGGTNPDEVEIDVDLTDGVTVRALPDNRRNISVSFDIKIPSGMSVERIHTETGSIDIAGVPVDGVVETTTGSIDVADVTGFPTISSSTGSIDVTGGDGVLSARTDTGSIDVEFRGLPSASIIPITTSTGSIRVRLSTSIDVDVRGETEIGSVSVDGDLDFNGTVDDDVIVGTVGAGGAQTIDVPTTTGSVSFLRL